MVPHTANGTRGEFFPPSFHEDRARSRLRRGAAECAECAECYTCTITCAYQDPPRERASIETCGGSAQTSLGHGVDAEELHHRVELVDDLLEPELVGLRERERGKENGKGG